MKTSTRTLAMLLLSVSGTLALAQTGPGNGAGAGPLSTTPGTSQAPAPQNNPPVTINSPRRVKKRKSRKTKRQKLTALIPRPIRPVQGQQGVGRARRPKTVIPRCLATLPPNLLHQLKIRHHKRLSKALRLRRRSLAHLLLHLPRVRSYDACTTHADVSARQFSRGWA